MPIQNANQVGAARAPVACPPSSSRCPAAAPGEQRRLGCILNSMGSRGGSIMRWQLRSAWGRWPRAPGARAHAPAQPASALASVSAALLSQSLCTKHCLSFREHNPSERGKREASTPAAPAMQVGTGFRSWYESLPPITRTLATAMVIGTLGARFGLLNPVHFAFFTKPLIAKFEVRAHHQLPRCSWQQELICRTQGGGGAGWRPARRGGAAARRSRTAAKPTCWAVPLGVRAAGGGLLLVAARNTGCVGCWPRPVAAPEPRRSGG